MKYNKRLSPNCVALAIGLFCFAICVFMLYFRPQESWCDDAFWADWAFRISQGEFVTWVWGGGYPSYSPLYAYLLAGWYKIVGFSFFTAQLPNLIFALISFGIICFRLDNGTIMRTKISAICFPICYWFADTFFWIYSCGRVDTLCLLLGLLTIDSFVRVYDNKQTKDLILFCIWSILEMATGFEGVLFCAVIIAVFSFMNIKKSLIKWRVYLWYIISSLFSFSIVVIWMAYHNCGKAFLRTTFGFSNTINGFKPLLNNESDLTINHERLSDKITNLIDGVFSKATDSAFNNKEYVVLLSFVIILILVSFWKKKWRTYSSCIKALLITSVVVPWIFIIAGRYTTYYTWTAYIPTCISVFFLLQDFTVEKYIAPLISTAMLIWFILSPNYSNFKILDFERKIDKQNIQDIEKAQIKPDEIVYVPYEWYYYLATKNKNLVFYSSWCWSWDYPNGLKKLIVDETDIHELEQYVDMHYLYNIGKRRVFQSKGDGGSIVMNLH